MSRRGLSTVDGEVMGVRITPPRPPSADVAFDAGAGELVVFHAVAPLPYMLGSHVTVSYDPSSPSTTAAIDDVNSRYGFDLVFGAAGLLLLVLSRDYFDRLARGRAAREIPGAGTSATFPA